MKETRTKSHWRLVVALGIFSIAVGAFANAYAILVVQRGPFPATGIGYLIQGFFFIGMGMGYIICAVAIKDLEKKIRKLEDRLYEPKTVPQNVTETVTTK